MRELQGIDLMRARLVPSSVFASPRDVVASPVLSRAQKLGILRRWEFDTRRGVGFATNAEAQALIIEIERTLRSLERHAEPVGGAGLGELPEVGDSLPSEARRLRSEV